MIDDYFIRSTPPHTKRNESSQRFSEQILRDRNGKLPDVLLSNMVEPATMFSIFGAIVSLVQAGDTKLWRTRVLDEFAELRREIHKLREQIAALGVHISAEIDRGFLEKDFRALNSTIKSYNANYSGYTDIDFARSHANTLLLQHELRSLELLEHNDFSTILQVSAGFVTHHELMHFAGRPASVRSEMYQYYKSFFAASLDSKNPESWTTRVSELKGDYERSLAAWQHDRPPPPERFHRSVGDRGYKFDVVMDTVFENHVWRRTSFNAFVVAVPPPSRGGGRPGDHIVADMAQVEMGVGSHIADESHCWAEGGPFCSQITEQRKEVQKIIDAFNANHRGLEGTLGSVRTKLKRAEEGLKLAHDFYNLINDLVDNPEAYPPKSPSE